MKMVPLACFPKDFDYNVRLVMIVTFLNICAQTIWQGGIMVLFVFMITHKSNEAVGFLAGLGGIVQLLSAPIVATSADSYSRPTILQYGSLVGLAGFMVATIAIIYANYAFLCAAMIILGIYNSIVNPTLDAVVADSIQQGGRSRVYTWKFVIQLMGKAVGPSVALVMFFVIGNEWTISSCQIVMLIGVTLYLIPLMLLRQFHTQDIRSGNSRLGIKEGLGIKPGYHPVETSDEEKCSSESHTDLETKGDIELGGVIMEDALTTVENDASGEKPLLLTDNRRDCGCNDDVVEKEGTLLTDDSAQMAQWRLCLCCCSQKEPFSIPLVPAMIVLSDFMAALASGMSIRFFPVFFMENMHLLPVELSCIDVIVGLFIAVVASIVLKGSKYLGRIYVVILVKLGGLSFFVSLLYFNHYHFPAWTVVAAFLLRTSFMNSTQALTKSVVMDTVPASQRVRWTAMESVNQASWAGSAVVGGYLMDLYGVEVNFGATICLQFISLFPVMCVAHLVPTETDTSNFRSLIDKLKKKCSGFRLK